MMRQFPLRTFVTCMVTAAAILAAGENTARAQTVSAAQVDKLSQLPLDRWKKLREVERYQLKIAEKYYRQRNPPPNYKVALGEYAKYLTLYERSDAAAFAQLMWSNCQVRLKKHNTAVKDGYQSVVDYFPDSPEAITARYLIGRTKKQIGEVRSAKKSLRETVEKYPKQLVAVFAMSDLVDITTIEKDSKTQVELWKTMTFDLPRDKGRKARGSVRNQLCGSAAVNLARLDFSNAAFDDAVKALATTYTEVGMPKAVYDTTWKTISAQTGVAKTKAQGEKLADLSIAYIRERIPTDISDPMVRIAALGHWYNIVELHNSARRDAKVLETYGQITKVFGADDAILGHLARWYLRNGRYVEARATYAKFKNKINGGSLIAGSHQSQGDRLHSAKKFAVAALSHSQATESYRRVLAIDSKDPVKWKPSIAASLRRTAYDFQRSGKKPLSTKLYDDAIGVYNELIKDDKKMPQQWRLEIARTHRQAGRLKQAIAVYRQCSSAKATNLWEMAECYQGLKQYRESVILYSQVAAGWETSAPEAFWRKAAVYKVWKKKALEIETLRQICKRFPRHERARQAHTTLQRDYKINVTLGGAKDK